MLQDKLKDNKSKLKEIITDLTKPTTKPQSYGHFFDALLSCHQLKAALLLFPEQEERINIKAKECPQESSEEEDDDEDDDEDEKEEEDLKKEEQICK
jgi:hypothetical protein